MSDHDLPDDQPVLFSQTGNTYHLPHSSNEDDSVCSISAEYRNDRTVSDVDDHMRLCIHCGEFAEKYPRLVKLKS